MIAHCFQKPDYPQSATSQLQTGARRHRPVYFLHQKLPLAEQEGHRVWGRICRSVTDTVS